MRKTLAEKARLVLAIVLVGILVFSSLSSLLPNQRWTVISAISTTRADSTQTALDQVLDPAVNYLYDNYNKSIGLIPVSPDTEELNNTYYIYSDNYLASLVLWNYDQSNLTLAKRAGNITNQMHHYLAGIVNPINQYMALTESVFAFSGSKDFDLCAVDGAAIKTTINNQSGSLDPKDYADIAFLQAVYYHELGRENYAMAVYLDGVNLYDGKGFKDLPFLKDNSSNYQTYKLALYIYASKLLGQDYKQQAFNKLLEMQQPNGGGGFNTSYDSTSLKATGYTNTETTSLAVLSLILQSPSSNSRELTYILLVAGALSAALILVGVWLKIVRRR